MIPSLVRSSACGLADVLALFLAELSVAIIIEFLKQLGLDELLGGRPFRFGERAIFIGIELFPQMLATAHLSRFSPEIGSPVLSELATLIIIDRPVFIRIDTLDQFCLCRAPGSLPLFLAQLPIAIRIEFFEEPLSTPLPFRIVLGRGRCRETDEHQRRREECTEFHLPVHGRVLSRFRLRVASRRSGKRFPFAASLYAMNFTRIPTISVESCEAGNSIPIARLPEENRYPLHCEERTFKDGDSSPMTFDLQACLDGDKHAWDAFVDEHARLIYAAVRRTGGPQPGGVSGGDQFDDIVQDVFVRLVKNDYRLLRSFDPQRAALSTFLTLIARSVTIDHLRKHRVKALPLEAETDIAAPADEPPSASGIEIPVHLLTTRQQLVLKMLFEEELPVEEVAILLEIDAQTVRSTKHKALTRLREHMTGKKE